jgi:hypothetical protein
MSPAGEPQPAFDRDYWLAHCEGYRVRSRRRSLGLVEEVLHSGSGAPSALVVCGGLFGTRRVLVRADDVELVSPRETRIVLRAGADG